MLDSHVLKQLSDADPSVRRKAVIALGKTQDEGALPYLATVHKNDSDPEIRQLAKKAAMYIRQHTGIISTHAEVAVSSFNPAEASEDQTLAYYEELAPVTEPVIEVSKANQERAQGLFKQALNAHLHGERGRALQYFQNALRRDPNLVTDPYVRNFASLLMRMSGEEAIKAVQYSILNKQAGRVQNQPSAEAGETWSNALIDLAIYALVTALTLGVSMLIVFSVLIPSDPEGMARRIENAQQGISTEGDPVSVLAVFLPRNVMTHLLDNYSPAMAVTYGLIFGLICVGWLFTYYMFVHLISVILLGGQGTLVRLITKATIAQAFMVAVFLVAAYFVAAAIMTHPEIRRWRISFLFLPAVLYFTVFSNNVGEAYRFGGHRAGQALLLGTFAQSIFMTLVAVSIIYLRL